MQKLKRQRYFTKKGEEKINCYYVNIPKEIIKATNITENDNLKITAKRNKVIIEKDDSSEEEKSA